MNKLLTTLAAGSVALLMSASAKISYRQNAVGIRRAKMLSVARKPLTEFRRQLMPAARILISSSWGVPMPITRMG